MPVVARVTQAVTRKPAIHLLCIRQQFTSSGKDEGTLVSQVILLADRMSHLHVDFNMWVSESSGVEQMKLFNGTCTRSCFLTETTCTCLKKGVGRLE